MWTAPPCDGPLLAAGPRCAVDDWAIVAGDASCWVGRRLGDGSAEVRIYPGCEGWPRWIATILVGDAAVACTGDDDTFAGCATPRARTAVNARWLLATVDGGVTKVMCSPGYIRPTRISLDWPTRNSRRPSRPR